MTVRVELTFPLPSNAFSSPQLDFEAIRLLGTSKIAFGNATAPKALLCRPPRAPLRPGVAGFVPEFNLGTRWENLPFGAFIFQ